MDSIEVSLHPIENENGLIYEVRQIEDGDDDEEHDARKDVEIADRVVPYSLSSVFSERAPRQTSSTTVQL